MSVVCYFFLKELLSFETEARASYADARSSEASMTTFAGYCDLVTIDGLFDVLQDGSGTCTSTCRGARASRVRESVPAGPCLGREVPAAGHTSPGNPEPALE